VRAVTHFDNFMDELTGLKAWHPLRRPPFHDSSLVYIFRGFSIHPWIFKKKKKFRFSRVPLFSLMLLELRTFKLKWIHMIFIHVRNGKNIYNWSCFSFKRFIQQQRIQIQNNCSHSIHCNKRKVKQVFIQRISSILYI